MSELLNICWHLLLNLAVVTYVMIASTAIGIHYLLLVRKSNKSSTSKISIYRIFGPITILVGALAYYGILVDAEGLGDQYMNMYTSKSCSGADTDECRLLQQKIVMMKEFGYSPNEAAL